MAAKGRRLVIGVLGGMGPMATVETFRMLTLATPADKDQDHLHVIIDSDPSVPDRTAALVGDGPSPLPWLVASAGRLTAAGADVIAMPCNTAHAFHDELQATTIVPILNMVTEAARSAVAVGGPLGLLATAGTVQAGLYPPALAARGLQVVAPAPASQRLMDESIYMVKAGVPLDQAVGGALTAAQALVEAGATNLLLACTEVSLLGSRLESVAPVVDALGCLATAAVQYATGARPIADLRGPIHT